MFYTRGSWNLGLLPGQTCVASQASFEPRYNTRVRVSTRILFSLSLFLLFSPLALFSHIFLLSQAKFPSTLLSSTTQAISPVKPNLLTTENVVCSVTVYGRHYLDRWSWIKRFVWPSRSPILFFRIYRIHVFRSSTLYPRQTDIYISLFSYTFQHHHHPLPLNQQIEICKRKGFTFYNNKKY